MSNILIAENISKQYRLGLVGTGTVAHDLNRWWHTVRGKEDPYLKVGSVNVRNLKATEDYVWALRDINFKVSTGEVLGIIGKNGAGKTTLLKILSRITSPTTGSIKTRGRIASLLEVGTGFHGELTGRENIFMNGAVLGMTKAEIKLKLDEIIAFSGCEKYIDTPVKRYSSGMTVRLGFAVAAHLEPEILVVDEVLAVGDAEFQKKAIGKMQDLSSGEGRTVLFVSHNMDSVQSLCTKAVVLENGNVVYEGYPRDAVEFYISDNNKKIEKEVFINDSHRRYDTSKEIELIEVLSNNRENTIREELKFSIGIKINKIPKESICITGSICSKDDSRIGSFFSSSYQILGKEKAVELKIPHHNLSVGLYYINLSISTGSIENANLVMLDHAYEAINFEILKANEQSNYLTEWNNNWGKLYFQSEIKIS